jgi:hypothetical protein
MRLTAERVFVLGAERVFADRQDLDGDPITDPDSLRELLARVSQVAYCAAGLGSLPPFFDFVFWNILEIRTKPVRPNNGSREESYALISYTSTALNTSPSIQVTTMIPPGAVAVSRTLTRIPSRWFHERYEFCLAPLR